MQKKHINFMHPDTATLADRLRCGPISASDVTTDLIAMALSEIRRRYSFLSRIDFPMFSLDENLMTYRLIHLTDSFLCDHPNSSTEDVLTYLLGVRNRHRPNYLLSRTEERTLILAYQDNIPGSTEMILTFFSPKIIATLKPLVFGITPDNHEDIEAVCLGSLDRLLKSFDPDLFDGGLTQNLVSLKLSNDILEEFGQSYSIPLHRRQINHLCRLHSMMQDPDFAAKSQPDRAAEANVPLAIVVIYDSHNAHSYGSDKGFHGISTHMDIQDEYLNSSILTALPSLALSMVEAEYDASIAEQDDLFVSLTEVVVRWIRRHQSRPSVAGKKIMKEFSDIKEELRLSDEDFDSYMREITGWMKVYANKLMP